MIIEAKVINGDIESQKLTLQANIPFSYLRDKVRFTHMKDDYEDPLNDNDKESSDYYQRRVDHKRIDAIKKHIRDSILNERSGKRVCVLFPTALLLATNDNNGIHSEGNIIDIETLLKENDGKFYIVDGQHRMQAMIELYRDLLRNRERLFPVEEDEYILGYLEKYEFNCSILLNFDLWEQAQIFADINFKQRKVDKSLYYAIYGLMDESQIDNPRTSAIFISHSIVKHLNTSNESPLFGLIKMLRNGKGTISQSFLADALIRNLQSRKGIWYSKPETVLSKVPYYAEEVSRFFSVIKSMFPNQWPEIVNDRINIKSIILKTNGMGALLRLMGYIHRTVFGDNAYDQPGVRNYLIKQYSKDVGILLSPLKNYGEELFGFNGGYTGSGGKGLESKLYRRMIQILESSSPVINEKKEILNVNVDVAIKQDKDGIFSFQLSHYFKNPDQMSPYIPGSGSIANNLYHLRYRLNLYFDQISKDASVHVYPGK